MRAVGRRVEEKIRERDAGEMMRVGGLVREHDALGIDALLRGGGAQPLVRFGVAGEQPKHAVRDVLCRIVIQRAKQFARQLLHPVQRGEDESVLGQAGLRRGSASEALISRLRSIG